MSLRPGISKAIAVADRLDPAALDWLQDGFRRWLALGGALPLHRCLGLPGSPEGLRKALRDYWLQEAFWLSPGSNAEEKYRALEAELQPLLGEKGRAWRQRGIPSYATMIERMLFEAVVAADMPGDRWRREIVLGSFSCQKLPADTVTTRSDEPDRRTL